MRQHIYAAPYPEPQPVRDITADDLLTWEVQFRREGTLPPEVQRRLLERVARKTVEVKL
jgi:hypothetical protein